MRLPNLSALIAHRLHRALEPGLYLQCPESHDFDDEFAAGGVVDFDGAESVFELLLAGFSAEFFEVSAEPPSPAPASLLFFRA